MMLFAGNTEQYGMAYMLSARIVYNKVGKEEVFALKQGSLMDQLYVAAERAVDGITHEACFSNMKCASSSSAKNCYKLATWIGVMLMRRSSTSADLPAWQVEVMRIVGGTCTRSTRRARKLCLRGLEHS